MITKEELDEIVRGEFVLVEDLEDVAPALADIEGWLEKFRRWRMNPDEVSLANFDLAVVLQVEAPTPFSFHSAGPQIVVRHQKTGRTGIFQAFPPRGFPATTFHYSTAGALVSLAAE